MPEKTDEAAEQERGLFWRALRAPENTLKSAEFEGVLTEKASSVGFLYGFALSALSLTLVICVGVPVADALESAETGSMPARMEGLYRAAMFALYYVMSALAFGFFFPLQSSRFLRRRDPARREIPALGARTAIRFTNAMFARTLRRTLFPWEWYLGRP